MKNDLNKRSAVSIISSLLCILLVPVIIINLILIIQGFINPNELPGIAGVKPAVVLSGSMDPTIKAGDLILIHKVNPADLKNGDVICYLSSGGAVTHRIISIEANQEGRSQFITQGDANNTEDSLPVTEDQIQGIWKGQRFKDVGNFILFIQTTPGMILFILCPLVLLFLWDFWQRRRVDQQQADKTARLEAELEALKAEKSKNNDQDNS